jgi:predicted phosphodiesterase
MVKQSSLENLIQANGAVVSSDVHGDYELISNSLELANSNNLAYVVNGDIVNDYAFKELANNMGYNFMSDMQNDYFSKNLSEIDLETIGLVQAAQQYGVDTLLSQVPEEMKEQFQKGLEERLNYSQSEQFQKRIQGTYQSFISEKGDEIQENQLNLRALYEVFMDEEAKRFAEELNKYSNVKTVINLGNHENVLFVEQVRQYLTNQDQITNLTTLEGHYKIEQNNGETLSLVGMTNCVHIMPYLNEVLAPEEMAQYYSHMDIDEIKSKSILSGNIDISKLEDLVDIYSQDKDYQKTKINNEGNADVFITHGQVGVTGNMLEVPYFASALKLSLESQLTIEGHLHKKFDGKNAFGKDMIRAVGNDVAVISKDINGNVQHDWVNVSNSYTNGHDTEIPYNEEYLKLRVEDLIKQYQLNMETQVSNSENQKAA